MEVDWGWLYGHIIACTGWTWDYIGEHMTLDRLGALTKYWNSHPPMHLMVAAYLGIKPTRGGRGQDKGDLGELIGALGAMGIGPKNG